MYVCNQRIKFTGGEKEGSIAFLDKTAKNPDRAKKLASTRKPHTDKYLRFNSHHPSQHKPSVASPGHDQNWIYSDVIELHKMAPTLRDAIRGHISALFSALKCSFPTVLWEPYLCIMKKARSVKKMASEKDFTRFYT